MKSPIGFLLVVLFCISTSKALDTLARDKCKELHHVDVGPDSAYSNNNCLLKCVLNGAPTDHNMNEGFPCPLAEAGICRNGQCVPRSVNTTPFPRPTAKLGSINVDIASVQLSKTDLNTPYVNVCVMNSTTPQTLPIKDKTTCTVVCNANLYGNPNPKWNNRCTGLFVEHSGVYIEVKDEPGTHQGGSTSVFLGGAGLTIPQLLSHGDNNKELHLALAGSSLNSGFINARIGWTKN